MRIMYGTLLSGLKGMMVAVTTENVPPGYASTPQAAGEDFAFFTTSAPLVRYSGEFIPDSGPLKGLTELMVRLLVPVEGELVDAKLNRTGVLVRVWPTKGRDLILVTGSPPGI